MKVTMVMLSSADGKTTRGNETNIYSWTSSEDQKYFFGLIKKNNLIVMGRSTYEAVSKIIKLEVKRLRIILTRHPKNYQSKTIKGQLEFSDENPRKLIKRLAGLGYKQILLVGGSKINGLFLKEDLVDEFFLTIEPKIFGSGKNIIEELSLDTNLKLTSIKKLNKNGTLLLKYKVIRHFSSVECPKGQ